MATADLPVDPSVALKPSPKFLRVLLFREESTWVAQVLEVDLATQARERADIEYEVERLIVGHVAGCRAQGVAPFELPPAPPRFWDLFEHAVTVRSTTDWWAAWKDVGSLPTLEIAEWTDSGEGSSTRPSPDVDAAGNGASRDVAHPVRAYLDSLEGTAALEGTDGCPRRECQIRGVCTRPTVCLDPAALARAGESSPDRDSASSQKIEALRVSLTDLQGQLELAQADRVAALEAARMIAEGLQAQLSEVVMERDRLRDLHRGIARAMGYSDDVIPDTLMVRVTAIIGAHGAGADRCGALVDAYLGKTAPSSLLESLARLEAFVASMKTDRDRAVRLHQRALAENRRLRTGTSARGEKRPSTRRRR